jgi:hypothetical protein
MWSSSKGKRSSLSWAKQHASHGLFKGRSMSREKPTGIKWPKITLIAPTREFLKKLWKATREYAAEFVPISYVPWVLKKKWQLLTYTHLSRHVALLLTCVIVFRERDALWAILREPRWPCSLVEWLVIIGTAGTLYAFKIEVFEKRRAVSGQELRFQKAAHMLLNEFVKFEQVQGSTQEIGDSFDSFAGQLLEIAALAFSLPHKPRVDAGLMVKEPASPLLKLVKWSNDARYDPCLIMNIPADNKFNEAGPAAMAFAMSCLVYVPKKGGRAWPLQQDDSEMHTYWPQTPCRCWVSSQRPEQEEFQTVICAPIAGLGVLNFSTLEKDAFINRDFAMAQYFANMLSQAAIVAREKTPRGT